MATWMIYGSTGYTGRLMVEEALKHGHRPVIAGRSEDKLRAQAEKYGLEYVAFGVGSKDEALAGLKQVADLELVLHCAGPFTFTGAPMLAACLELGVHYLDITGEIMVFENTYAHDAAARDKGIVLMSGVGFDIVPSDCLGRYVAEQVPGATQLDVFIDALGGGSGGGISAGTAKSAVEMMAQGGYGRRDGKLVSMDQASATRWFQMPNGRRLGVAASWGDISSAYRTTGIPNISTWLSMPPSTARLTQRFGWLTNYALKITPVRRLVQRIIERRFDGPDEQARREGRSRIYARASAPDGRSAEAWLETMEAYAFTVVAALKSVERVLDGNYSGALTPACAFGADFVLEIETTTRMDRL